MFSCKFIVYLNNNGVATPFLGCDENDAEPVDANPSVCSSVGSFPS